MEFATTLPLVLLACGVAAIACGAGLLRWSRELAAAQARVVAALGWFAALAGFVLVGGLAGAQFTARLGPEQLWFRAPTFYLSLAVLLSGALWWVRRPASRFVRFGAPGVVLALLGCASLFLRLDGHSAPLAMLLPTMSQAAPQLSYFDNTGTRHELSELKGKVVLLNFWATWCAPCRHELPLLSKLQAEHAPDGFVVLYISLEDSSVLDNFLRTNHFNGVQGRLEQAAAFYDAGKFYPLSYLISRDGLIVQRWSGRARESWLAGEIRAQTASRNPRLARR